MRSKTHGLFSTDEGNLVVIALHAINPVLAAQEQFVVHEVKET